MTMTKAIVMNTKTGAVSEYDSFAFQSITPTHMGSATGLFQPGGDLDIDLPVVAVVKTGKTLWSASMRKFLDAIYVSIKGTGDSIVTVDTEATSYSYPLPIRDNGVSRAKPGRGIRENYLAFGYSNADGADFQLDRIEVPVDPSKNRRI